MKKAVALFAVTALAAVGLVACGGDDDGGGDTTAASTATETTGGGGGGGGQTLTVTAAADGQLAYDTDQLTAKAGTATLEFDNPASISHDVKVEDSAGNEIGGTDIIANDTATASLDLKPGTYTFFCSIPGHREAGMEGTLTVN